MNPDYLSRLFKNEYGVPLKEHIVTRKMRAAQVLLKTTALPVGVIASKVGYDNYSYFSQAYKKALDIPPRKNGKSKKRQAAGPFAEASGLLFIPVGSYSFAAAR